MPRKVYSTGAHLPGAQLAKHLVSPPSLPCPSLFHIEYSVFQITLTWGGEHLYGWNLTIQRTIKLRDVHHPLSLPLSFWHTHSLSLSFSVSLVSVALEGTFCLSLCLFFCSQPFFTPRKFASSERSLHNFWTHLLILRHLSHPKKFCNFCPLHLTLVLQQGQPNLKYFISITCS